MPKNPGGRPTKYKPIFAKKLIKFFDIEPNEVKEIPHYKNGEVVWTDYKIFPNKLPTFTQFAKSINVHRDKISVWANMRDKDSSRVLRRLYVCKRIT